MESSSQDNKNGNTLDQKSLPIGSMYTFIFNLCFMRCIYRQKRHTAAHIQKWLAS